MVNKVAKWFKERRGWTQQMLADVTGVSQQYIQFLASRPERKLSARMEDVMSELEKNQDEYERSSK